MQNESKKLTKVEIAKAICNEIYSALSQGARDCWIHWICMNYRRPDLVRQYNAIFDDPIF